MTPVLEAPSVAAPPFRTVLVANRGEIARRIIRTLRRLGIRSIAVYSDADASAPHVLEADDAVRIGPAPAADSYLRSDAIIAAAVATGAQAIHPGYGFLSENAEFAAACSAAGIVFVGPDTRALEIMGDKIRAKQHVEASGVPVIAGVSDPTLDDAGLVAAASTVAEPSRGIATMSLDGAGDPSWISRTASGSRGPKPSSLLASMVTRALRLNAGVSASSGRCQNLSTPPWASMLCVLLRITSGAALAMASAVMGR